MKSRLIKQFSIFLALLLMGGLTGCDAALSSTGTSSSTAQITFDGASATVSGSGATADGSTVTITSGGTYTLSGSTEQGQVIVSATSADAVELILDNLTLTNSDAAGIYITQAKNTTITLQDNTQNTITSGIASQTDTATQENPDDTDDSTAQSDTDAEQNTDTLAEDAKAAIWSNDDIVVSGGGSLQINAYLNNGIHSSDTLCISGGTLLIDAANNGLDGKDNVTVSSGTLTITAGNDGIQSDNDTDTDCGTVILTGGDVTITSDGDGIQAATVLNVSGGTYHLTCGGGSTNGKNVSGNQMQAFDPSTTQTPPDIDADTGATSQAGTTIAAGSTATAAPSNGTAPTQPSGDPSSASTDTTDGTQAMTSPTDGTDQSTTGLQPPQGGNFDMDNATADETQTVSTKGFKAGTELVISGGALTFDTCDDAIHSNGTATISDAAIAICTGDDAIHAEDNLTIDGGTITVDTCYEGLEAVVINFIDGDVQITASDDGVNANGNTGTSFGGSQTSTTKATVSAQDTLVNIEGGTLTITASGDGLDSNGSIAISGGTIVVSGSTNGGNSAIDYGSESDGTCVITGGSIIATGYSAMAENFDDSSTQCAFLYVFDQTVSAGTQLTVTNDAGQVILDQTIAQTCECVVVSDPALTDGQTYTVTAGDETGTITLAGTISTHGTAGTGNMGRGMGNMGGQPNSGPGNRQFSNSET